VGNSTGIARNDWPKLDPAVDTDLSTSI
jgi:hypothetical protein